MLPLLIVRPEPGASQTAARAAALGLAPHVFPLFAIAPVPWQIADAHPFDALLLTSANAVRHAGDGLAALAGLRCFVVGQATADAARSYGLNPVCIGTNSAQPLVDAMVTNGHRDILWLTGVDHSPIEAGSARIKPVVTYTAAQVGVPAGLAERMAHSAIVMLHSARAARRMAELAGHERNHLIALAISENVARASGTGWHMCLSAAAPTDADMLAIAQKLCQTQRL